jgi:hypothetical protein
MTDEKIKTAGITPQWGMPIELIVQQIELLTLGEGTPYSEEPISHEPPGIITTIIRRFLYADNLPDDLRTRLKICDGRMQYIVQPSWHEGYDACSGLKKRYQLEPETLKKTGYIEATYRYSSDKQRWYWFLAGWLSAMRTN